MSLFGPNRPKGITKEELRFVRGELQQSPFGNSSEKLTSRQVDEVMEDLEHAMDPDTAIDMKYGWAQANAQEVAEIERDAANNKGLVYSPSQIKHIHTVLAKYLDINKVKSSFSL